ncbi:MAG: EAL domain-containing protein, partial [Eubacterium sp.]|nr:EAL domain-containing protein [Eubacterium sp.]
MENYILTHFQEALDKGWICAFYQPIIRTITGCFAGVEALARWIDPVYGCIMPSVFVPVLEKSGKIWQLDCHILQEVLKLQRSRMDAGLQVGQISVNLSRMDFDHVDMLDFIREQVRRFRISKDLVCLEITENVLVQDKDRMIEVVRQLRASGFQIWMDDFGSGYSSLTFLNDYRLDVIKLDMEFLRSFNRTSREIIRSTIHMAKNLGIRTIAEGVERKDQVDFLKSIGCDMMQGWYFGKPCS